MENKVRKGTAELKSTLKNIKLDIKKLSEKGNPVNLEKSPKGSKSVNDSALSAFNIHHPQKQGHRQSSFNKENKFNTLTTENIINSKDNFFKKESYSNRPENVMIRDQSVTNNYESGNNFYAQSDQIAETSPGKSKQDKFRFSDKNFNSRGSLSLSDTANNNNYDSDNEYSNYNIEKRILNQQNEMEEDAQNDEHLNHFSNSGTFKSNTNNNEHELVSNSNISEKDNSHINFTPQSQRIRSAAAYDDLSLNRKEKSNHKNVNNKHSNNNVSHINVNNSNINDMIKRDLKEYISNLENKNLITVKSPDHNKIVLEFRDTDETNTEYNLSSNSYRDRSGSTSKMNRNKSSISNNKATDRSAANSE